MFENPEHDFPPAIIYRLEAGGSLFARVEATEKGETRESTIPTSARMQLAAEDLEGPYFILLRMSSDSSSCGKRNSYPACLSGNPGNSPTCPALARGPCPIHHHVFPITTVRIDPFARLIITVRSSGLWLICRAAFFDDHRTLWKTSAWLAPSSPCGPHR